MPDKDQDVALAIISEKLKRIDEKFGCFNSKLDKFDKNLTNIVNSFNQDKQHIKIWAEEKFVEKKQLENDYGFIRKGKNILAGIGLLVIITLGSLVIGGVDFVKSFFK